MARARDAWLFAGLLPMCPALGRHIVGIRTRRGQVTVGEKGAVEVVADPSLRALYLYQATSRIEMRGCVSG